MKKYLFSLSWIGIGLAIALSLALITACPTDDNSDSGGVKLSEGLYEGTSPVNLTGVEGDNIVTKSSNWLEKNAKEGGSYTIVVGSDIDATLAKENSGTNDDGSDSSAADHGWFRIVPYVDRVEGLDNDFYDKSTVNGVKKITITLKSDATLRTIKLKNKGTLLEMGVGKRYKNYLRVFDPDVQHKLILENIVLKGLNETDDGAGKVNNAQLVYVGGGAILEIKAGARITGNHHRTDRKEISGSGIIIAREGQVILDGGSIDNNIAESTADPQSEPDVFGAGVCVRNNWDAIFIMKSGTLSNNTARSTYWSSGGGIGVESGRYRIEGGTISGNIARSGGSSADGGAIGLNFRVGEAIITGGTIKGNQAVNSEGQMAFPGVRVRDSNGSDTVTVSGNPDISDGLVLASATTTIKVGGALTNTTLIPVHFTAAPVDGRQIIAFAEGQTGTLPVDKFQLGKLYKGDGTSENVAGSIDADGKYKQ